MSTYLFSMPGGAEWILIIVALAFVLALIGFWIYTIVDIVKSNFQDETTKIIWLLVVVLIGILGSLIYWIFGRSGRVIAEHNNIKNY